MSLADLVIVYVVAGLVFAILVWRRTRDRDGEGRAAVLALIAIPAWPLWAPFALGAVRAPLPRDPASADVAARIDAALREGVAAAAGTPLETLLSKDAAEPGCSVSPAPSRR